MKTLLLIGTLLFQSALVLMVTAFLLIKATSEVGFYYVPPEFYVATGLPALTYIFLQLFYFTSHWHPEWKNLSRIITLVLIITCLAFVVYAAFNAWSGGVEPAAGLVALGIILAGILTCLHVQRHE